MPLNLSQLQAVMTAANLFAPSQRGLFLRSIAGRLASEEHPSDSAVERGGRVRAEC